ncbi:hypothetical protein [Singulisphaera sp. PoT]|uniref:hypothetical protein n=1 Tax=Singulisphaera sp. PoT TaxID=3411797 RepID=UPI003BF4CCDE
MVWADGDRIAPVDYRVDHKLHYRPTKNGHLLDTLRAAERRGFEPSCVAYDT